MRKILNLNVKKIIKYVLLATLFIAVGWMFILNFFTHRASDKSLDASCKNNLRLISSAINSYCNKNNDFYPPTLETLLKEGFLDEETLKCPLANIHGGGYFYTYRDARLGSDYNYTLKYVDNPQGILCWDKIGNHSNKSIPDTVNVLFRDGGIVSCHAKTWEKEAKDYMSK